MKYYHAIWETVEWLNLTCETQYGRGAVDVHALARRQFGMVPWTWDQFIGPFCDAVHAVMDDGVSPEEFAAAVEQEFRDGQRRKAQRSLMVYHSVRPRTSEHAIQRAERVSRQRKQQARSGWARAERMLPGIMAGLAEGR